MAGRPKKQVAPPPEPAATATAAAAIDARAFIRTVNREALEKQIEEARQVEAAAKGEVRSLLSLRRMIDYRDGKLLRKSPKANAENTDGEPSRADADLLDAIQICLARASGVMTVRAIAVAIAEKMPDVEAALKGRDDLFTQVSLGCWVLAEDEADEEDEEDE